MCVKVIADQRWDIFWDTNVQALADISRLGYVITTKPMHQLQIRPIVHS